MTEPRPSMDLRVYDFDLPRAQIAQRPAEPRDASRLLVLPASGDPCLHRRTRELAGLLPPGALLVVNDTRVVPARLAATKPTGGRVEFLVLRPGRGAAAAAVEAIYRTARRLRPGTELRLPTGGRITVLEVRPAGRALIDLRGALPEEPTAELDHILAAAGHVPLPPYIRGGRESPDGADRDRYQCVYAREPGAIAAPTAGLHFTPRLLADLKAAGIQRCALTLHVGPGTFQPVRHDDLREHRVPPERFELSEESAATLGRARAAGRPIVAVGTTTTRALETIMRRHGRFVAAAGEADLTIVPGHRFAAIDGLLTNFHLPRSSLLVLVAAFAGRDRVLGAYREAVRLGYRFYSYGDAMLLGDTMRLGDAMRPGDAMRLGDAMRPGDAMRLEASRLDPGHRQMPPSCNAAQLDLMSCNAR